MKSNIAVKDFFNRRHFVVEDAENPFRSVVVISLDDFHELLTRNIFDIEMKLARAKANRNEKSEAYWQGVKDIFYSFDNAISSILEKHRKQWEKCKKYARN
ncbi:MAG: hypothetical protein ACTSYD_02670 [Candidatus Heimdallarchaeaceae archaeon]